MLPRAPRRRRRPRHRPHRPPRSPPAARTTAKASSVVDPRFPNGPLVVLDGDGSAYGVDGVVLDCPANTVPELVAWASGEAGLGAPPLNRHGFDADPLVVLTAAAAV